MAVIGTTPIVQWWVTSALYVPILTEQSMKGLAHTLYLPLIAHTTLQKVPLGLVPSTGGTMLLPLVQQAPIVLPLGSKFS